jgi:hypothetical protein
MAPGYPLSRIQSAFACFTAKFHKKMLWLGPAFVGSRLVPPGSVTHLVLHDRLGSKHIHRNSQHPAVERYHKP